MADKDNLKKVNEYTYETNDDKPSNPFSNAFKSLLQKMHLIKPDQTLIGDKDTNSRGFQTTSKDPFAATDKKSLKAILRTAFEDMQKKRAENIRAKASPNKLQVHKVGETQTVEQVQDVSKDPTKEVIRPLTASERAAQKAQQIRQAPNIINNTVIMAEAESAEIELEEVPSAAEIEFDETFEQNQDRNLDQSQDGINKTLETVNIEVDSTQQNQIIMPKVKPKEPKVAEKNDDELSI